VLQVELLDKATLGELDQVLLLNMAEEVAAVLAVQEVPVQALLVVQAGSEQLTQQAQVLLDCRLLMVEAAVAVLMHLAVGPRQMAVAMVILVQMDSLGQ
jgi:hypothetical protein